MQTLFGEIHFLGCGGCGVVPFVVFSWFWQVGEVGVDVWFCNWGRGVLGLGVEGEGGGAFEGVGHYYYSVRPVRIVFEGGWWGKKGEVRFEYVWPH